MAKGTNQKLKLVYLMKILLEKTDETHSITMPEIISSLEAYDITAERKSIYADMEALRTYGMDIIGEQKNKTYYYHVGNRQFELAELKLLVDSVQASKFITAKKSNELIKKIEGFASKYEAKQLQRQVFVTERIKTMNETIYYNVDKIHAAIGTNVKIKFQYFQWNVDKKMELRHGGEFYYISPWALTWDDENYYLIGFDSEANIIKHYRVDKMLKIELTEDKREGKEHFTQFDMAVYAKKMFGMFDGEEQTVKLEFENRFAGVVIDRFGKNVTVIKTDEEHFTVNVNVAVSGQFLAWVIALGDGSKIVGPESVVSRMRKEIERLNRIYL
ncbi:helix-turn-helix transcriptional regulator [[Clostridium] fimetarium]|uniref:Predicted DNA-binding transcriptional regulator YafY, contains an HTH and WYL domains n=1 Tax=[Clostridium] fimetarium TaxID=99656 RepID=A0A1I0NF78_9FIRM|nr:WYL domain-containing protein [[Clostridium] fimetarium]SEV99996.1 Predicted DNA-binding transcriptional regulator YafY, contains an HTH and WYL domains [[Clostridium] fimetarium]